LFFVLYLIDFVTARGGIALPTHMIPYARAPLINIVCLVLRAVPRANSYRLAQVACKSPESW
jgi:NADH:ubiquinone oxidoreductase subunit